MELTSLIGRHVGHWRIEQPLGKGGAAAVYFARHVYISERIAAIKVLHTASSLSEQERFQLEASAIHGLKHPNIVELIDFGYEEAYQTYFMVQECLQGYDLSKLIQNSDGLSKDLIWILTQQICSALTAVHKAGLIHRDLKPSNLFLIPHEEPFPRLKLLDFGIAKYIHDDPSSEHTGSSSLHTGESILGTPKYLAPEQVDPRYALTPQADIYALGVILYELCTGRVPIHKSKWMAQTIALIEEERPKVGQFRDDLADTELEACLYQMVQKDPKYRPQTIQDAYTQLEAAFATWSPSSEHTQTSTIPFSVAHSQLKPNPTHTSPQSFTQDTTPAASPALRTSSYGLYVLWSIVGCVGLCFGIFGYYMSSQKATRHLAIHPYGSCVGKGLTAQTQRKIRTLIRIYQKRTLHHFKRPRDTHYAWVIGQMAWALQQDVSSQAVQSSMRHLLRLKQHTTPDCSTLCYARLTGQREHSNFVLAWSTIALLQAAQPKFNTEIIAHLRELIRLQTSKGFWMIHPKAQLRRQHASVYSTVLSMLALTTALEARSPKSWPTPLQEKMRKANQIALQWLIEHRIPNQTMWKAYPASRNNEASLGATAMVMYIWARTKERPIAFKQQAERWIERLSTLRVPPVKGMYSQDFHPDVRIYLQHYQIHDPTRYLKLPWIFAALAQSYPYVSTQHKRKILLWIERAIPSIAQEHDEDWRVALLLFGLKSLRCPTQPDAPSKSM